MDCYFHEGIKVLYRVSLAILILFHKHTQNSSEWNSDSIKNDIDNAIPKFCKQIPVSPLKLMRTAFSIRALRYVLLIYHPRQLMANSRSLFHSSSYITRVFIKTEMVLKSKSVCSGNKQLVRSRSTDNLPTSQSQINIQMMSHTLTIREVRFFIIPPPLLILFFLPPLSLLLEVYRFSNSIFIISIVRIRPQNYLP